jgi:hypothetical protein
MPRKVFDGFSILDAEDVNTYLMDQAVMSFAGTAARGSAIPAPTDGMVTWLQDSDTFAIYNGSSWADPTPKETLVFLGTQAFSAVTSSSLNSVFSATYTSYKIIFNVTSGTGGDLVRIRVRASGTDLTTNTYETGEYFVGTNNNIAAGSTNSSLTSFIPLGSINAGSGFAGEINISDPFTATNTRVNSCGAGGSLAFTAGAVLNTTSYDGFTLLSSANNMTGTMTVYGIRES